MAAEPGRGAGHTSSSGAAIRRYLSFEAQSALRLDHLLREDGDPEANRHLDRAAELAESHDLRCVRRLLG